MRLLITKDALVSLLHSVAPAVARKNTMPILGHVRLTARQTDGAGLFADATDLDLSMSSEADAAVATAGAICVSHKALTGIAAALPKGEVRLDATDRNALAISAGRYTGRIAGMAADEFPKIPAADAAGVEVDPAALLEAIDAVAYAQSSDETRAVLCGAHVSADGVFVATDGHRLSLAKTGIAGLSTAILPRRGVDAIRSLLVNGDGPVTLAVAAGKVIARRGGVSLAARLIDGKFPDVAQVIPTSHSVEVGVDGPSLLAALKRIGLVAPSRAAGVAVEVEPGLLRIRSQDPDKGEASEELSATTTLGAVDEFRIGFNGSYLADAVAHAASDVVTLRFTDALSPGTVLGAEGRVQVVMPMRI